MRYNNIYYVNIIEDSTNILNNVYGNVKLEIDKINLIFFYGINQDYNQKLLIKNISNINIYNNYVYLQVSIKNQYENSKRYLLIEFISENKRIEFIETIKLFR